MLTPWSKDRSEDTSDYAKVQSTCLSSIKEKWINDNWDLLSDWGASLVSLNFWFYLTQAQGWERMKICEKHQTLTSQLFQLLWNIGGSPPVMKSVRDVRFIFLVVSLLVNTGAALSCHSQLSSVIQSDNVDIVIGKI